MKTSQVFGIAPEVREYSYIDRGKLDETCLTYLDRSTHIAIRGPSKSGKSWLRQKILGDAIVVQSRLRKPFSDLYVDALSQLDIKLTVKESSQGAFKANLSAIGEGGAALLTKVGINAGIGTDRTSTREQQAVGHDINDLRYIADIIKSAGRRLAIEDFHYMSTDDRRKFAFDLKALWDYGVFVVIIGVWCETNLLMYLNPDLTGRVMEISVDWSPMDLENILVKGCKVLKLTFDPSLIRKLTQISYSNAGLFQQLTLLTLDEHGITSSPMIIGKTVNKESALETASMLYADQLNPVYQQFARRVAAGIRTRKNATGIYAHAMAVIMDASDEELIQGLNARIIFERAVKRQERIQYSNLKVILEKLQELQIDEDGRGLIIGYSTATEDITIVDRQLLLYRRFATVKWPWEDLIEAAEKNGGQLDIE